MNKYNVMSVIVAFMLLTVLSFEIVYDHLYIQVFHFFMKFSIHVYSYKCIFLLIFFFLEHLIKLSVLPSVLFLFFIFKKKAFTSQEQLEILMCSETEFFLINTAQS